MGDWTERFGLKGKHALVTGASNGIGLETCKVLADAGADIGAVGRDREGLAEAKAAVEALGRRCVAISADMASADGPVKAAHDALAFFGHIDILVNNAGVALIDRLEAAHGAVPALIAARLIVEAALARHESRGGHYRSDYPDTASVARHTRLCRVGIETMATE